MAGKNGIEAGRAFVKAWLDDSAVTRGLKQMRTRILGVAQSLRNLGTKLIGGGAAIGSLFLKPIADAGRMQAVFASFETIFKGSTEAMGQWSDALAKALGRSRTDLREFMTQTQGRLLAAGMDPAQAEELNKQLAMRALDLAQFWDKDDAQAFQAMQNALTGEMEMLKQFGIVIHDADTKAKLKAMGLDPATASQAQKAHARFELMLQRSAETQGTAARESGEWSSRVKRLWAEIQTLSETIGGFLLPVVLPLMGAISGGIGRVTAFAKAHGRLIVSVAATAAAAIVLGSVMLALSLVIHGAVLAAGGLAILLRGVLYPATVLVSAATAILRGTVVAFATATRAAAVTVAAVAASLRAVAAAARIAALATEAALLVMTLFRIVAVKTRLALVSLAIVTQSVTWAMRAAAFAVGTFGVVLKATAALATALGVALAIFANPVVGAALALAGLGAAIYYAVQQGVRFRDVLDWLRESLGPLAAKAQEVFGVIHDALLAGQWSAAARVMWAAIQLAFAHGIGWITAKWIDMKHALAEVFVDLAASVQKIWAGLTAAIVKGLTDAITSAIGIAAGVAKGLGLDQQSMNLSMIGVGVGTVGGTASERMGDTSRIEERRRQTQATLDEDAARERARLLNGTAEAEKELQAALEAAKAGVDAAKEASPATPPGGPAAGAGSDLPDAASAKKSAESAINTAAIVGTQSGADALLKAMTTRPKITPGEKAIVHVCGHIKTGIDDLNRHKIVMTEDDA